MSQSSRIRVLFVAQGLRPTGPGRHLVKLLVYRNPAQVDVELFTFDRNDPEMLKMVTEEYGIKVTEVGIYFAHPMAYIRGIPMLLRRIREYQPHIIQTHHSPIVDWAARLVTKWSRVPVNVSRAVVMPKVYQTSRRKNIKGKLGWWFSRFGDWLTSFWVDYYLPNSMIVSQYLQEEEKIPSSKIILIHNGVDTDFFAPGEAIQEQGMRLLSLTGEERVISCVGLIKAAKGQFELARATVNLMHEFPEMKVVFVGKPQSQEDAIYMQAIQRYIEDQQLSHQFLFTGELQDVRPVLAVSDLYVHPSHLEGSPNALLEAMSMGCPCIVSDADGCREPVKGIGEQLIFPVGDAVYLEKSIRLLWCNDAQRRQIGANMRQRIISEYSVHKMCSEVESVYRLGLAKKGIKSFAQ